MKVLFVTSIKEYQKAVADILYKAGIDVFSVTKTIGFKEQDKAILLDNWFGSETERFDSIFVFSFTDEERSDKAMELIKQHNAANQTGFPIRAFVVPVEKSSYHTA